MTKEVEREEREGMRRVNRSLILVRLRSHKQKQSRQLGESNWPNDVTFGLNTGLV